MPIVPAQGHDPAAAYNGRMHSAHVPARLLVLLGSLLALTALAQTPGKVPATQDAPAGKAPEQTIERIRHEDAGSRIDELRVGGETKNITVQPKGDAPAYQVAPESNNRNPSDAGRGSGGWNIFKY